MRNKLTIFIFILCLSISSVYGQKVLTPAEKKVQDSTKKAELAKLKMEQSEKKKIQDSLKKVELESKRIAQSEKMKQQKAALEAQRKKMAEDKKIQDSIKKANLQQQKTAVKGNMPPKQSPEEKRIQDSIKKATLQQQKNSDMQKKMSEKEKREQEMKEKKEAMEQLKAAKTAQSKPMTPAEKMREKKTQDSLKKVQLAAQKKNPKGAKKPGAPVTAASKDTDIDKLYFGLPVDALSLLKDYLEDGEETDDKDFRRSFIEKSALNAENPNYIKLKRGNTKRSSSLQVFTAKEGPIIAIEYSNCMSIECNNNMKVYLFANGVYTDATVTYLPKLNKGNILDKIKSKYKKDYQDLELYKARGYEQDDIFNKAIIYQIQNDGKIILKDQFIDYNVAELVWDKDKNKFEQKKIKD